MAGAFGQGGGHRAERLESEDSDGPPATRAVRVERGAGPGVQRSGISHVVRPCGAGGGAPKEGARLKGELAMQRVVVVGRGRQAKVVAMQSSATPRGLYLYRGRAPGHLRT